MFFYTAQMADKREYSYHHGDLRSALVEVATEMIAAEGVDALTLRELSRRVGVSRTAPYRHFADKSALLAAVAEEGFQRLHECLRAVAKQTAAKEQPLDVFKQMGGAYIEFAVENPTHYRLMFGNSAAQFGPDPNLEATAKTVFDVLVTSIQQLQNAHLIKAGDPRLRAYVVWSTIHGLSSLLIDKRIERVDDVQGLINFTTQSVLDGLV